MNQNLEFSFSGIRNVVYIVLLFLTKIDKLFSNQELIKEKLNLKQNVDIVLLTNIIVNKVISEKSSSILEYLSIRNNQNIGVSRLNEIEMEIEMEMKKQYDIDHLEELLYMLFHIKTVLLRPVTKEEISILLPVIKIRDEG